MGNDEIVKLLNCYSSDPLLFMHILFLDLASSTPLLALATDERTITVQPIGDPKAEEELVPLLKAMLRLAGCSYADLTHLAATIGPGGFMSIRTGVSLTNALAYTLKIPSVGIHLSDLWHARVLHLPASVWLHSTRRTQLFVRGFGAFAAHWPQPQVIELEELQTQLKSARQAGTSRRGTPYVGELIAEHEEVLRVRRFTRVKPMEDILPAFLRHLHYQSERTLLPWYGRKA